MYAIELPRELLGRLAQLRAKNGKPIARQVRDAVKEYCDREEARAGGSRQPEAEGVVSA